MSDNKNVDNHPEKDQVESIDTNLAVTSDVSNVVSSVRNVKVNKTLCTDIHYIC